MKRNWTDVVVPPILVGITLVALIVVFADATGIDLFEALGPLGDLARQVDGMDVPLSDLEIVYLGMGIVFVAVGLTTLARRGVPAAGRAYGLWANDPVSVRDLYLERGAVEVEGTAEPIEDEGTISSPYTGTECLAFEFEHKESRQRVHDDDTTWRIVEHGATSRPFSVTDDTGTVAVDPAEATLSFDRDIVVNSGRLIKTEWRLEPGESVYVSGQKQDGASAEDAPGGASTYIGAGDDPDAFTVSDASERWTVLRFTAKGIVLSLLGLLFIGVGGGLLYGFWIV